MKRILLILLLGIWSPMAIAQTTWTGLGVNTNWNNVDNWDTNIVPTASDDVIIPTGLTVTLNVSGNVQSIDVQGNSILEINSNLTFTGNSNFGPDTVINWSSGALFGDTFTLTNQGELNLISNSGKTINNGTIVNNEGVLNITSSGDLFLNGASATLNNQVGGVIDMQFDAGNITWGGAPGVINNTGLIKKTVSTGEAQIIVTLNNNNGTIQVEDGTLSFQNSPKNFTDGTYNVFSGATLDWDNAVTISGSLEGTLSGNMNWNQNIVVAESTQADLNFSENFNWTAGTISGGGTLTNNGSMTLTGNGSKTISTETTLNNLGSIAITSSGDLFLNGASATLNNQLSGVIDMQSDSGNITWAGAPGVINNTGLIKKTVSTGEAQIIATLNNNDGTIQVEEGTLSFQNSPKNFTDGTYNVFSGATLDWDNAVTISGSLEGTLSGSMNWNQNIVVAESTQADLNFSENLNWTAGTISGGGTLTNNGSMTLTGNGSKTIASETTVNNFGSIAITSSGDFFINGESTILNNQLSGVIDMQSDSGNITWAGAPGVINNTGLIKKTVSTGEAQIIATLNNNDGTIQVEEGTLSFQNSPKNFTDGTYNVFSGATLDWDNAVTISGSLEGTLSGSMNWNQNIVVAESTQADLNFSENLNWTTGTISGGGTLTNNGSMTLTGNGSKTIASETTLNNLGNIAIASSGDLLISGTSTMLNNQVGGIIDLQFDAGNITWAGASGILNNFGLIRRSNSSGLVQIFVDLNNSGTIEVASGELEIASSRPFVNETTGIVKGVGIFDLPTTPNYTNNGIFAPGLSPGTLNVQGDYTSTSTSQLEIELNGLVPDTEHDVLAITGNNNVFEGSVNVIMGFEGNIGDEFTIATTSGSIASENLQTPIENVDFDGKRYTFEVSYPDNNKVVLTITGKLDILPPNVITQNITVQLDASGNASISPSQIDNGSTDNCTPTNELQFALDIDAFTCSDLGDNIVNLTVTDNDGNFASAPATVTVEDIMLPTVITQDITVQLDASGMVSITAEDIDDGSSDNCAVASLSLDVSNFDCSDLGENTVTLTVVDPSGNSDSATAIVTVEDNILPTVITQDITVQLDASGMVSITAEDIDDGSSDNCAVASLSLDVSNFDCSDLGENTVTLTVVDPSGNSDSATATVTVEDTIDPVINCPTNLDVESTGAYTIPNFFDEGDVTASDNCTFTVEQNLIPGTLAPQGEYEVIMTVTDASGNTASCSFNLKVDDLTLSTNGFELSENSIVLYPNPVNDVLQIKNTSNQELIDATIYDVTGKIVQTIKITNDMVSVSMTSFASGVYFVRINSEKSAVTKRFIKQ